MVDPDGAIVERVEFGELFFGEKMKKELWLMNDTPDIMNFRIQI